MHQPDAMQAVLLYTDVHSAGVEKRGCAAECEKRLAEGLAQSRWRRSPTLLRHKPPTLSGAVDPQLAREQAAGPAEARARYGSEFRFCPPAGGQKAPLYRLIAIPGGYKPRNWAYRTYVPQLHALLAPSHFKKAGAISAPLSICTFVLRASPSKAPSA